MTIADINLLSSDGRMDGWVGDIGASSWMDRKKKTLKGNMWSATPVALLCMIVNWSERKQGSGPKGDEVQ